MKKNSFFHQYISSLSPSAFYKEVAGAEFSSVLKYFVTLALFATLVTSLAAGFRTAPKAKTQVRALITQVENIFPEDLVLSSKNNEWSINKPEPFVVPFPVIRAAGERLPKNLIVFYHDGTVDDLEKYETLILVNKVNIITVDQNKIQVVPIKDVPDGQLTKADFVGRIKPIEGIVKYVPVVVVTAIAFGAFIYFFGYKLGYLLVVALFIWAISSLAKYRLSFGQAYKVSLHTITLPLTLQVAMIATNLSLQLPYWFFIVNVLFGVAVLIVLSKENGKAQSSAGTTAPKQ